MVFDLMSWVFVTLRRLTLEEHLASGSVDLFESGGFALLFSNDLQLHVLVHARGARLACEVGRREEVLDLLSAVQSPVIVGILGGGVVADLGKL